VPGAAGPARPLLSGAAEQFVRDARRAKTSGRPALPFAEWVALAVDAGLRELRPSPGSLVINRVVYGHTATAVATVPQRHGERNGHAGRRGYGPCSPPARRSGPAAEELRNGTLPDASIDWLKTNFFKTELELCRRLRRLRLPAGGLCECDSYLTYAKFVTTPVYAPRLRARRNIERALALDAAARGWDREVERYWCTGERIEKLLADLGEPLDGPERHTPARPGRAQRGELSRLPLSAAP
jgi:hypothetical protein